MGYTRNTGQLSYLITYDGSGNITVPASFTQTTVTSSMLKADSSGKLVAAVAGTDFVAPAGLSAYVPTTRTITINGTSYDLSADRSWSIVSGVSSFNTRTGAITLADTDVTGALGYTPVTNARTITINGTTYDLSANRSWSIVAGISSFNTRTGDITLLDTDVTGALGYTPVTNARTITINGTTYDLSANRTWVVDASSVTTRVIQKFTATASQTTFTVTGGYTVGMVDVFLNGVKLDNATEFTASNGSTVVLTAAAAVNDVVEVYKYGGQFIANNTLRQTTAFTATAGQTTFTVNYSVGFVDVFYNGAKLAAAEFTATNGTSIVLGTACVVNDIVEVVAYNYTVGAFTGVGGSGTTNYISKWTASGTLGNSLIFDNGTNIGIGTTTPNSILEIKTPTATNSIRLGVIADDNRFNMISLNGVNTEGNYIGLAGGGSTDTNLFYQSGNGGGHRFRTGNGTSYTERMRITSSGNVGIGTTNTSTEANLFLGAMGTSEGGQLVLQKATSYTFATHIDNFEDKIRIMSGTDTGSSTVRMVVDMSNGNVGIGTATPSYKLHIPQGNDLFLGNLYITGTANNTILDSGATGGSMLVAGGGNGAGKIFLQGAAVGGSGYIKFDTDGSERMRINQNGIITIPNQPAFSVYKTGTANRSGIMTYNATILNRGNCVNLSNGRFTAPVAGAYQISFMGFQQAATSGILTIVLYKNGANTLIRTYQDDPNTGYGPHATISVVMSLNANDYIEVRVDAGEIHGNEDGFFSGYLIG